MARPARRRTARDNSIDPLGEFALGVREQIFYLLFHLAHRRDKLLESRLAPLGLSTAHWRCLSAIRRVDDCSMSDLARFSCIDRTTLTRSVDHLVAKGLVERDVPPADRRLVILRLTAAGETIYADAVRDMISVNDDIIARAPPFQQREFARGLEALLRGAIADPAEADDIVTFARSARKD